MNAVEGDEIRLNDRFTYGAGPFGAQVLTIALVVTGTIVLVIVVPPRASWTTFFAALAGLYLLAWLAYKRLLKLRSDIALDEDGITRYIASGPWLSIPWASIQKVTVERVYFGNVDTVGCKLYVLSLTKGGEAYTHLPRSYGIQGMMSRRVQFYGAFLANLRLRGIAVDERDSGAP